MTEQTRFDRVLPGLFDELADARTPDYLEAAIQHASSRSQRPAWAYPGRWLPVQVTTVADPTAMGRWRLIGVIALVAIVLALATVALVGSRWLRPVVTVPLVGPAGNGVIALAKDGDIFVADRPGGLLRPLIAGPEDDQDPMFSADGSRLAFSRVTELGSFLMVADADGANLVQLPLDPTLGTSGWTLAPEGGSLMTLATLDGVQPFDLQDQRKRVVIRPVDPAAALTVLDIRLPGPWMENEDPVFHPTNRREILVFAQLHAGGPRGLYVYDLASGAIRTVVEAPDMYVNHVAWLPDGEHITYNGRIVAADGSGDRAMGTFPGVDQLSPVSNDGTRIVIDVPQMDVSGDDSGQRSVVTRIDGRPGRVELGCGLGMAIECPTSWIWSPDDSVLIGTIPNEISSVYMQADPETGRVVLLDWEGVGTQGWGTPAWQRVAR